MSSKLIVNSIENTTGTHTINLDSGTNTGIGAGALENNTGSNNSAVGNDALNANTTASSNTAVGYQAAYSSNANYTTAVGRAALRSNTSGTSNTAVGDYAGYSNTTGIKNAVVGAEALQDNTTGNYNTAMGYFALHSNTTADNNTAVGYQAGRANITGRYNNFSGSLSGYNSTGENNTFVGFASGYGSTGDRNTIVGARNGTLGSGQSMTTGNANTILGGFSGSQDGLDIRTSSNNIVLSDGDGNPRLYYTDAWYAKTPDANIAIRAWRQRNTSGGSIQVWSSNIGGSNITKGYMLTEGAMYNSTGTYGTLSDERLKQDIVDANSQWDDIKALQFRNYRMISDVEADPDAASMLGVIAQEVEQAGMNGLVGENEEGYKHVKLSILYMKAVKALQEAMDRIETLEAKVTALEAV